MPEKPLFLTRHARNKRRRWRITNEEIEEALEQPEVSERSGTNRVNYWRRWRDAWLRVTAVEETERTVIITIVPRERGPGGTQ
jgi:hypothetical protein